MHRLVYFVLVVGCSSPTQHQVPAPPQQPPVVQSVSGYWSGDWGKLVLRETEGKIIGAYSHDQGTITGTMNGDTLVAWWCEVPSRKPSKDAGDVEMKFLTDSDGKRRIDGKWRYGSEGAYKEDWDLVFDTGPAPEDLLKRLDDASAFCAK